MQGLDVDIALEVEFDMLAQALSRRLSDWLYILSDDAIKDLADNAEVVEAREGEVLFSQAQQDNTDEMWILLDGMVQGTLKPRMREIPVLLPAMDTSLEDSKDGISSKSQRRSSTKVKRHSVSKKLSRHEAISADKAKELEARIEAEENIKSIQAHNDAILPVQLFATRTFGAAFGDESLISTEKRPYTLTAITNSKLCKISKDYYLALFLTEEQIEENLTAFRKTAIVRAFNCVSGSVIDEIFPKELQKKLQNGAILRRFHSGQQIMKPTQLTSMLSRKQEVAVDNVDQIGPTVADAPGVAQSQPQDATGQNPEPVLEGPSVFFLQAGQLEICKYDDAAGVRQTLSKCETEGAIFGELGMLVGEDGYQRLVEVAALTDCLVCELPSGLLSNMLADLEQQKDFMYKKKAILKAGNHKDEIGKAGMYLMRKLNIERQGAKMSLTSLLQQDDNLKPVDDNARNQENLNVAREALNEAEAEMFVAEKKVQIPFKGPMLYVTCTHRRHLIVHVGWCAAEKCTGPRRLGYLLQRCHKGNRGGSRQVYRVPREARPASAI